MSDVKVRNIDCTYRFPIRDARLDAEAEGPYMLRGVIFLPQKEYDEWLKARPCH